MSFNQIKELGPLATLLGEWEGNQGDDVAPSDERTTENNKFIERMKFEYTGLVQNHEQHLYGLRYSTVATRIGDPAPFHEELGYWLWDAKNQQVLRCFMVPRGVTVIAGGTVKPDAKSFHLSAVVGSDTYGICSNKFLDEEFKTMKYDLNIIVHSENEFSYEENTQLKMKGKSELFQHVDKNKMKRIK